MLIRSTLCLLVLSFIASPALANVDFIGLFADEQARTCELTLAPGTSDTVRVLAVVPSFADDGIRGAEFRVTGLPEPAPGQGFWTVSYPTEFVLGEITAGVSIVFTEPQMGLLVELATLVFMPVSDDWVGADHGLAVEETLDSGIISILDHLFQEHLVLGGWFTLNCSDPPSCVCISPGCVVAPAALDFGRVVIGDPEDLEFVIGNDGSHPFSGAVSSGSEHFTVIGGGGSYTLAPGEELTVRVRCAPQAPGFLEGSIETGTALCLDVRCEAEAVQACQLQPGAVDFGTVLLGSQVMGLFRIINPSGSEHTLHGEIELESTQFRIFSGGGPFVLTPGMSRIVRLVYEPLTPEAHAATVTLGTPLCSDVSLSGDGELPGPHFETAHIGLYPADDARLCRADLTLDTTTYLQLVAVVPELADRRLIRAELRLLDLPPDNGSQGGDVDFTWEPGVTATGDPRQGLILQLASSAPGWIVPLGTVALTLRAEGWVGDDHALAVGRSLPALALTVTDAGGGVHAVAGSTLVLNCSDPEACPCGVFDPPVCLVDPLALDFGNVLTGETAEREFVVMNLGGGLLEGEIRESCPRFALTAGAGPFALAFPESLRVRVAFTPDLPGDYACAIETGLPACGPVQAEGTGEAHPACSVAPDSLGFGELDVGEQATLSFRITNTGGGVLTGAVVLNPTPHFSIVSGGGPFALGAGAQRTVQVRFAPQSFGYHTAAVTLGSALCQPSVPLTGQGRVYGDVPDHIGLFADAAGGICDGIVGLGAPDTVRVLIKAPVFAQLGITGAVFRVSGLPPELGPRRGEIREEWLAEHASGALATGITLRFDEPQLGEIVALGRLIFIPTEPGWIGEDVFIDVEAAAGQATPLLLDAAGLAWRADGTGYTFNCTQPEGCPCEQAGGPICVLDPEAIDFHGVHVGSQAYRDFLIRNDGFGTLSGAVAVHGEGFSLVSGGGPFHLAHGQEHAGRVRFSPSHNGYYTGWISTQAPDCPSIPLAGQGYSGGGGYNTNFIGISADDALTICYADIPVGSNVTTYYSVYVTDINGCTGAEFRVDHLPPFQPPDLFTTETWYGLTIGELGYGFSIALDNPSEGPLVPLGTVSYYNLAADFGSDWLMYVMETFDSGNLIITDLDFNEIPVMGGSFVFNCSDPLFCICIDEANPVALSRFTLTPSPGRVDAEWEPATAEATAWRLEAQRGEAIWEAPIQEAAPGVFHAADTAPALAAGGDVTYRLSARESEGDWQLLREEGVTVPPAPLPTALLPGHPNPFNPRVTLPFTLSAAQDICLAIYDVAGRRLAVLAQGRSEAGRHETVWTGSDGMGRPVASGVYFARLDWSGGSQTRKLVLLR